MKTSQGQSLALWETLQRREVFDGSPWIRVYLETLRLPDGSLVDDFYTVQTHDFVSIVALNAAGELLMLRQYRHGVHGIALNFPAGYIQEGEDALLAARRELLEETGYGEGEWEGLGSFIVDGNRGCGRVHYFMARNVLPLQEPCSGDLEEQQVLLLTAAEVSFALQRNEIKTLPSVCAFLLAMGSRQADE